jgi:hypothetical protein
MSLPRRIADRKRKDPDIERQLRIRKHDPLTDRYGGVTYSPADIEALENERLPWLKRKRNRS